MTIVGIDIGVTTYRAAVRVGQPLRRLPDRRPPAAPSDVAQMAKLIAEIRADAGRLLARPVAGAVLGTRATVGMRQRWAIREAARRAGFATVQLVDASAAAVVAHAQVSGCSGRVLVYCLGAGPCEVAIVQVDARAINQLVVGEEPAAGGWAFDQVIADYLEARLDRSGLLSEAERLKIALTSREQATVLLSGADDGPSGLDRAEIRLTREELERLLDAPITRSVELIGRLLAETSLKAPDLDDVLLVGRSCRIPLVHRRLSDMLGLTPVLAPDGIVAVGAALLGASLDRLTDTPPSHTVHAVPSATEDRAPSENRRVASGGASERAGLVTPASSPAPSLSAGGRDTGASPGAVRLVRDQARTLTADGRLADAILLLEQVQAVAPDDAGVRADLTTAYARGVQSLVGRGKGPAALDLIQRSSQHQAYGPWARPLIVEAHLLCGRDLARSGRPREALDAYAQAISFDPINEVARAEAVEVCLRASERLGQAGRLKDAASLLQRGLSIDVGNSRLLERDAALQIKLRRQGKAIGKRRRR